MNKKELAAKVAKQTSLTLTDATKSIDAVFQSIREEIAAGNHTTIKGFGSFSIGNRAERKGINPATKEPITIAACKVVKFKPSKSFEIK